MCIKIINNVSYANIVHETNSNEKFQYYNIIFTEGSYALVDLDDEDEQYCLVDLSLAEEEDNRDDNTAKAICCSYRCTDYFTPIEIEHMQKLFSNKSREDQQQYLLDQVILSGSDETDYSKATFQLQGRIVCKTAISKILHISYMRLKRVYNLAAEGTVKIPKAKRMRLKSMKYTNAVAWFDTYTQEFGEKMPHIKQIHLPCGQTKKSVYDTMRGISTDVLCILV